MTTDTTTTAFGVLAGIGSLLLALGGSVPWVLSLGHVLLAIGTTGVGYHAADRRPPSPPAPAVPPAAPSVPEGVEVDA